MRKVAIGSCSARYGPWANANIIFCVAIESLDGLGDVEAIAAVEDIDMIAYGHSDLGMRLGPLPAFQSAEHDVPKQHHEVSEREASRCLIGAAVPVCVRDDLMPDRLLPGRQVPVIFQIACDCEANDTAAAVGKRHAAEPIRPSAPTRRLTARLHAKGRQRP
jgi:hypothetical protein